MSKDGLPDWFPQEGNSEKLLEPVSEAAAALDTETKAVQDSARITSANSKHELDYFAEVTGTKPDDTDSLSYYRKRIITSLNKLASNGSIPALLEYASLVFQTNKDVIEIDNIEQEAKFVVRVPQQVIENEIGSISKAEGLFRNATAAGYGVEIEGKGTLEPITESEYDSASYDPATGYDSTTSNDGGTYSGLITNE